MGSESQQCPPWLRRDPFAFLRARAPPQGEAVAWSFICCVGQKMLGRGRGDAVGGRGAGYSWSKGWTDRLSARLEG